jgi:hypothetical protein
MRANYVFQVTIQIEPPAARLRPDRFETVCRLSAPTPGTDGWLFFQQHLWRGAIGDSDYTREVLTEKLAVPVVAASFSELETDAAYREALAAAIETDLPRFNADSTEAVLHQHLGSSIHLRDPDSIAGE